MNGMTVSLMSVQFTIHLHPSNLGIPLLCEHYDCMIVMCDYVVHSWGPWCQAVGTNHKSSLVISPSCKSCNLISTLNTGKYADSSSAEWELQYRFAPSTGLYTVSIAYSVGVWFWAFYHYKRYITMTDTACNVCELGVKRLSTPCTYALHTMYNVI